MLSLIHICTLTYFEKYESTISSLNLMHSTLIFMRKIWAKIVINNISCLLYTSKRGWTVRQNKNWRWRTTGWNDCCCHWRERRWKRIFRPFSVWEIAGRIWLNYFWSIWIQYTCLLYTSMSWKVYVRNALISMCNYCQKRKSPPKPSWYNPMQASEFTDRMPFI